MPPLEGRLRQLETPLGTVRELSLSINVQTFYLDFSVIYFPFPLLSFVLSIFVNDLCYAVVFGVCCLSITFIVRNTFPTHT